MTADQLKPTEEIMPPTDGAVSNALPPGSVLLNKYVVLQHLHSAPGKADLYFVKHKNKRRMAKIHTGRSFIKPETAALLKNINHVELVKPLEFAEHNGTFIEITPYYSNGSLQGCTFGLNELKTKIIPALNLTLKTLHANGFVNINLKPANIMLSDDEQTIAVMDFARNADEGQAAQKNHAPEYLAPEAFGGNRLTPEADYYALGITLFELFCGYAPYAGMPADEIARFAVAQKITMPQDMPHELQDLLTALTYYDANAQPNGHAAQRWTFEQVERWCDGEKQPVPAYACGALKTEIPPYKFQGAEYTNICDLARAFALYWEDAKNDILHGRLAAHLKLVAPETAEHCREAAERMQMQSDFSDVVFWRLLYHLNPDMRAFYWKNRVYDCLPALGREMLEKLWQNDDSLLEWYQSVLNKNLLNIYVALAAPGNDALKQAAETLMAHYQQVTAEKRGLRKTLFITAYLLSDQKILNIGSKRFRSIGELFLYLQDLMDNSIDVFKRFCNLMVDKEGELDAQLEAWLLVNGKQAGLENWRGLMAAQA